MKRVANQQYCIVQDTTEAVKLTNFLSKDAERTTDQA